VKNVPWDIVWNAPSPRADIGTPATVTTLVNESYLASIGSTTFGYTDRTLGSAVMSAMA
jgi:hypothetical protein